MYNGQWKRYWAAGRKPFGVGEMIKGAIVNGNEKAGQGKNQ